MTPGLKWCPRCRAEKPLDDFPADPQRADGRHGYCKPCKSEYMSERYHANREALSEQDYRRRIAKKYGITPEEYDALLALQGGGCAICGATALLATGRDGQRFAIDHDHQSGRTRGLLCSPCNAGLSNFDDDVERLGRAAAYLTNPPMEVLNYGPRTNSP